MLLEVGIVIRSLDAPLGSLMQDDEVASLSDLLEDPDTMGPAEQVEQQELITFLTTAIDRLPERECLLLSLYYHEELTMKEISKVMGISESRVCQLHMQAVMRLRGNLHSYDPDEDQITGPRKPAVKGVQKTQHASARTNSESRSAGARRSGHRWQRVSG